MDQRLRGGLVEERNIVGHALGISRQRLDQGQTAADRRHPGGRLVDEIIGQKVERHAKGFEPLQGDRRFAGEGGNQFGVGKGQRLQQGRPLVIRPHGFLDDLRVRVAAGIGGQLVLEIFRDGVARAHAPIGFGVAGVAAAFCFDGALQHANPGAVLLRGHRRRQPGDTATDDDQIEFLGLYRDYHRRSFPFWRQFSGSGGVMRTGRADRRTGIGGPIASLMAPTTNFARRIGYELAR